MDPLNDRLKSYSGGRILDVATSHGDFLKVLTESFGDYAEAIGIDNNSERVKAARENCDGGLEFEVMDGGKMSYGDSSFDTVAIRHSLHHLEAPGVVLAEMKRVLKPGGLFIVCEVLQSPEITAPNAQRHIHHWWGEVDRALGKYHGPTYTSSEVIRTLKPLGLNIIDQFEQLDKSTEEELKQFVEFIGNTVDEYIGRLQAAGGHEDIIDKGRALKEMYEKQGYVDEKSIYVIARK
ncbi:MAG: class I SAM-dependent methyltransferase [Candidatus Zixiibacteriota bacterium]